MNRQIRQLAVVLMGLYVVLFAGLNYWQVEHTDELASEPGNTRALERRFNRPRGQIVTADGVVVARSMVAPLGAGTDVKYQRLYPEGDLYAGVVGYYTFGLGSTQIERTHDDVLTGESFEQQVRALEDLLNTTGDISGQVQLTLRADLQNAAKWFLGPRDGSVVVLDTHTGAVLAMWSNPSFDPNLVAQADYDKAYDYVTELQADPRDPLLMNAYQQRYMPGSTFKVLTTGAALDAGVVSLESVFESERQYVPPQTDDPIENYGGSVCGGDLTEVFYRSCNTPFARTAIALGPDRFEEFINRWGVGEAVPIDLPGAAASTIGDFTGMADNLPLLAMRGFGQNDDQMVPLHMAMVAATVANAGEMLKPYVVAQTLDHHGNLLGRAEPEVWKRPISRATAGTLQDLMTQVAERGTASCCIGLDGGIPVAAKTGTAQLNGPGEPERSHAWTIAFAPADQPRYAIAVVILGTTDEISASTGGRLAGPVVKGVLDAALATDAANGNPYVPAPPPGTVTP